MSDTFDYFGDAIDQYLGGAPCEWREQPGAQPTKTRWTAEEIRPKRYPDNKPSEGGLLITFWVIKANGAILGFAYPATYTWDNVLWFIDIPNAPEPLKPAAYPENRPDKNGLYWCHCVRRDDWDKLLYEDGAWWDENHVFTIIDYYIPYQLGNEEG